jgi:hypothetical protein
MTESKTPWAEAACPANTQRAAVATLRRAQKPEKTLLRVDKDVKLAANENAAERNPRLIHAASKQIVMRSLRSLTCSQANDLP